MSFENSGRLLRRLPALALMGAAAWLLVEIALTGWGMAQFEPPSATGVRPAASERETGQGAPGNRLFGLPAKRGNAKQAPSVIRNGNFRLTGVVATANRKLAHAIIETGGVSETYFLGDTVASGILLQEVRPNEVLLRRGADTLRLPLSGLAPAVSGSGSPSRSRSPIWSGAGGVSDDLLTLPRETLSQLINMEPVMNADGRMEGYRLSPRSRRAWFDSLGLLPGDLLVAVNGIAFDPDNLAQARREMSGGNDMMLTVLRGGEQLEIAVGSGNFGLLAM
ncbi:MAG: hypothetical protein F4109_06275 [Gammaproteobacteria bacterium]|nr:hypothetical protein [Gammaproteobacteria bacterium]MYD00926.1 hypothetical protein [Gammaproteobacteria bacterium]MYI25020.1 hypothetical protein [Gammaproteobacteria bacterium]